MSSLGEPMLGLEKQKLLRKVAKDGHALWYASKELQADREIVMAAVAQNGRALEYASQELQADHEIVAAAVAKNGYALRYASEELQADREIVAAAVAKNGLALRYASKELQHQLSKSSSSGATAAAGSVVASAGSPSSATTPAASAAASADSSSAAADERPSKRAKTDDHIEQRLAELMGHSRNATRVSQRALSASHYLRCYDRCGQPFQGKGVWATPLASVLNSLPAKFHKAEWQTALEETAADHASADELTKAGVACAYLWTKTPIQRMLQQVILADEEELLGRVMPYLRCLNAFVLNINVRVASTRQQFPCGCPKSHLRCACVAAFAASEDKGVPQLAHDEGAGQAVVPR
jgi:hypothetical protein